MRSSRVFTGNYTGCILAVQFVYFSNYINTDLLDLHQASDLCTMYLSLLIQIVFIYKIILIFVVFASQQHVNILHVSEDIHTILWHYWISIRPCPQERENQKSKIALSPKASIHNRHLFHCTIRQRVLVNMTVPSLQDTLILKPQSNRVIQT